MTTGTPVPVAADEVAPSGALASEAPSSEAPSSSSDATTTTDSASLTDDLLDELRASRGVRHEIPRLEDEAFDVDQPPAAHPPASAPEEARDAAVLPLPVGAWATVSTEPDGAGAESEAADRPAPDVARKPRSRSRRTSVPSWDEIVFGAKPE